MKATTSSIPEPEEHFNLLFVTETYNSRILGCYAPYASFNGGLLSSFRHTQDGYYTGHSSLLKKKKIIKRKFLSLNGKWPTARKGASMNKVL